MLLDFGRGLYGERNANGCFTDFNGGPISRCEEVVANGAGDGLREGVVEEDMTESKGRQ